MADRWSDPGWQPEQDDTGAGYAVQPGGPSGPRAGFGKRLAAFLIDLILISIPITLISALFQLGGLNGRARDDLVFLVEIGVFISYFTLLEGGPAGQTIGKKAMAIRVVRFSDGQSLGYATGALRTVGRYVSSFVCGLGYFWMLWDKEKQTWHDKMANSVVVPVSHYPLQPPG